MARTANVQELAEAMKAQSVTANWDVVVSYTTEKLNKVLQNVWVQGYGSEMPDSVEIKPMTGANQSANEYSMKLHNPTLSFVPGDSAVALLKMGLSGTAWIDGNKADAVQIVMGTFEIELQVPLVSVPDGAQMSGDTIPDMQVRGVVSVAAMLKRLTNGTRNRTPRCNSTTTQQCLGISSSTSEA